MKVFKISAILCSVSLLVVCVVKVVDMVLCLRMEKRYQNARNRNKECGHSNSNTPSK